MTALFIRGTLYILLAIALAQLALFEAVTLHEIERFSESGYIELSHAALLSASTLLLAGIAWRVREFRTVAGFLALAFAILTIRENDQILEMWLPHGFWKWPATVMFAGMVWIFIRRRQALIEQGLTLTSTMAFGVMLAGFTAMVFSRFFGRTSFWEAVMEERYVRVVKNAAEESVELFGIGLMTAGVVELAVALRERKA